MTFVLSGAITGGAQTGFTSPTYTVTADTPPDNTSKQWIVSSLGGTQTGVNAHTINNPFTLRVKRSALLKTLGQALLNGITGQYSRVPFNPWDILTRKGAALSSAGQVAVNTMRTTIQVAAGSETYSGAEVRALCSFHIGALNTNSAGLGDMCVTGIMG